MLTLQRESMQKPVTFKLELFSAYIIISAFLICKAVITEYLLVLPLMVSWAWKHIASIYWDWTLTIKFPRLQLPKYQILWLY